MVDCLILYSVRELFEFLFLDMCSVSVIILNFNRKDDVLYTIGSIYKSNASHHDFEIILVDQNSSDGSPNAVSESFPEVNLFCSNTNLGVAGGRNKGVELAKGDILVFLDDDAHFKTKDALLKIQNIFDLDQKVGIVGFKIFDVHQQIRDWQYHLLSKKHADKAFYTQQYVGCGHAIRTNVFKRLGGYSTDLFFWGEEIEFCLKTFREKDCNILYWPGIEVIHRVSPISRHHWKTTRTSYKTRNRFAILLNYFPRSSIYFYLFFLYFFIGYFVRGIQNSSLVYFFKGFKESFSLKLADQHLCVDQAAQYSRCFMRQFIGKPKLYK